MYPEIHKLNTDTNGEKCYVHARGLIMPDGFGILTTQKLDLSGWDVFYGIEIMKTSDGAIHAHHTFLYQIFRFAAHQKKPSRQTPYRICVPQHQFFRRLSVARFRQRAKRFVRAYVFRILHAVYPLRLRTTS